MTRALFWLAFFVLVIFAVRSKIRKLNKGPPNAAAGPARASEQGEAMACCAHCHVYFPASESVRASGLDYCSTAHVGLPEQ
jgi:uncharacterized protein